MTEREGQTEGCVRELASERRGRGGGGGQREIY